MSPEEKAEGKEKAPTRKKVSATVDGVEVEERRPAMAEGINPDEVGVDHTLLHHARVLLVDDSQSMRRILAKTLETIGAEIGEAENGMVGLRELARAHKGGKPFELVLLDMNMPEMNGLEMLKRVRSVPELRSTPVIILSTENERATIVECARYGIASYIIKGGKTQQILDACAHALAGRSRRAIGAAGGGLSSLQVTALKRVAKNAAQQAVESGVCQSETPDEEPVLKAVLEFLEGHAGGERKDA